MMKTLIMKQSHSIWYLENIPWMGNLTWTMKQGGIYRDFLGCSMYISREYNTLMSSIWMSVRGNIWKTIDLEADYDINY